MLVLYSQHLLTCLHSSFMVTSLNVTDNSLGSHFTVGTFSLYHTLQHYYVYLTQLARLAMVMQKNGERFFSIIGWFGCMCVREGGASRLKYGVTVRYLTTHIHIYIDL